MNEGLLTKDEIITLTGYKQRAKQLEQLRQEGIGFTLDQYGNPIVTWANVSAAGERKMQKQQQEHNWGALSDSQKVA